MGAVAESVVWRNASDVPAPTTEVCVPPFTVILQTVVAPGSALVSVSVTVGLAAVVVPVVIVQEQV
jgi:hypothetical protein